MSGDESSRWFVSKGSLSADGDPHPTPRAEARSPFLGAPQLPQDREVINALSLMVKYMDQHQ